MSLFLNSKLFGLAKYWGGGNCPPAPPPPVPTAMAVAPDLVFPSAKILKIGRLCVRFMKHLFIEICV